MSLFNTLLVQKTFKGHIKTNENSYGLFCVNSKKVRKDLSEALLDLNKNLSKKIIQGYFKFCKFENHEGNNIS